MALRDRLKGFEFNFKSFLAGFIVGLIYIYFKDPELKVKVMFPTPFNAGKVTYKDDSDTCFEYTSQKVQCPKDNKLVRQQPVSL
jgi:hypothetical protein